MNTKKSLGHFPFGQNAPQKSDYSFIPNVIGVHESNAVFKSEAQSRPDISMDKQDMPVKKTGTSNTGMMNYIAGQSLLKQLKSCPRTVKNSCSAMVTKAAGKIFSA